MITQILLSATAAICLLLVGVNLAFVIWAKVMFLEKTYRVWRLFFLGKSMMSAFIGIVIWEKITDHARIDWELPLAALGGVFSSYSLWRFYKIREHFLRNPNER